MNSELSTTTKLKEPKSNYSTKRTLLFIAITAFTVGMITENIRMRVLQKNRAKIINQHANVIKSAEAESSDLMNTVNFDESDTESDIDL
tara:strand:+ start:1170 stop:1436 length:267 start_codon:yes stop_codon:yes gene_type:complete